MRKHFLFISTITPVVALMRAIILCVLVATVAPLMAEETAPEFIPPANYRSIRFVEYGGGPEKDYSAPSFEVVEIVADTKEYRVVFSKALPPSTATRTVVAGIFLLVLDGTEWRVVDQLRFEASGKYAGASLELTSFKSPTRLTLQITQGGRGYSYSHSCTYLIEDLKLTLDVLKPTPIEGL